MYTSKNKPRHYITNHRSISLLNWIYKTASENIAGRTNAALQNLYILIRLGLKAAFKIFILPAASARVMWRP